MNRKPMVTVIIPTYNRAGYIGKAIQSVLDQTWQNFEIIVVDDGSEDDTERVVRQFNDSRIKYMRSDQNYGACHARNIGIGEAMSEYTAFLDSDACWNSNKLEKQISKMAVCDQDVALVYCRVQMVGKDHEVQRIWPPYHTDQDAAFRGNMFRLLLMRNMIDTSTMLIRTSCLREVGGFEETLTAIEDWELALRISEKWKIEFVEDILVDVYTTSDNRISLDMAGNIRARCYMVEKYWKRMAEEGLFDMIIQNLLLIANQYNLYEETKAALRECIKE